MADAPSTVSTAIQQLDECWDLLIEIASSRRPVTNGFSVRARELLVRHGVIESQEKEVVQSGQGG